MFKLPSPLSQLLVIALLALPCLFVRGENTLSNTEKLDVFLKQAQAAVDSLEDGAKKDELRVKAAEDCFNKLQHQIEIVDEHRELEDAYAKYQRIREGLLRARRAEKIDGAELERSTAVVDAAYKKLQVKLDAADLSKRTSLKAEADRQVQVLLDLKTAVNVRYAKFCSAIAPPRSHLAQIKQFADRPEFVSTMRESWDPGKIPFKDRIKAKVTFEFVDMPLTDALEILTDATGVPIDPVIKPRETAYWGQVTFAAGILATMALVMFVLIRAIRKRQRMQFSLRWLWVLTVCLAIAVQGLVRWKKAEYEWEVYNSGIASFKKLRSSQINLRVTDMSVNLAVEWVCKLAEVESTVNEKDGRIVVH